MWSIGASNPEGRAFMTVIIVFYSLAVLAYGLRVYSRRLNRAALDASDQACFLGLVSYVRRDDELLSDIENADMSKRSSV